MLTVATDKPAYPPYFEDDDPTNGEGFESAVAYAIAKQLGYPPAKVKWTVEPFNSSYAPGPKDFDFDVNEISITPPREKAVDFSSPYYTANQAVVALKDSDAAKATSLADLQDAKIGVQIGTTSLDAAEEVIEPEQQAGSLQQLQRRRHGAEERTDRRRRRRPADGALHHRRPGPERDRGRPVRRSRRRPVGRAAGQRLTADRLRLRSGRRAEELRRARPDHPALDEPGRRRPRTSAQDDLSLGAVGAKAQLAAPSPPGVRIGGRVTETAVISDRRLEREAAKRRQARRGQAIAAALQRRSSSAASPPGS